MMEVYALTADQLSCRIYTNIVLPLIALMVILALMYFIIGGIKNMSAVSNSPADRKEAFRKTLWMVFGLFVIIYAALILRSIGSLAGEGVPSICSGGSQETPSAYKQCLAAGRDVVDCQHLLP